MTNKAEHHKLNHEDIITAVVELIAHHGLAELTMRKLASSLNCSVGTLPYYFKNKHDMVIAALRWSNGRILNRLNSIGPGDYSIEALTPLLLSSLPLDQQADLEWRVRLCLWGYATTNPDMLMEVERVRKETMNEISNIIKFVQQRDGIRANLSSEAISSTVYHMTIGLGFNLLHLPMPQRQKQLAHLLDYIHSLRPMPLN